MNLLAERLHDLEHIHLLVVGDIMLDQYTWGNATRVSPEAPVLILRAHDREIRLGGAGSVACLARHLNAEVTLAGVLGDDPGGRTTRNLLVDLGIHCESTLIDPSRCTTTKERFVGRAAGRHSHQILRVDREDARPIETSIELRMLDAVESIIDQCDIVLISDYGKGVCTPRLLTTIIQDARQKGIPILIDPARSADYKQYSKATILTPNRTEAEEATGMHIVSASEAVAAGNQLCHSLDLDAVLLTLDKDGIAVVGKNGEPEIVPTRQQEVYDITGAGDMVLAVAGLCRVAGLSLGETAIVANAAAGLEIERFGVAPVGRGELLAELRGGTSRKVVSQQEMAELADGYRHRGHRIVFTNGCFDLLHHGHVSYLGQAASFGDVLVVAVNSDASVRAIKGPERPVISEEQRTALLAALGFVTHVLVFDEPTPTSLLQSLKPDVLVKGGDYRIDEVVGREIVEAYGGQVHVLKHVDNTSTTSILSRIRSTC